jgi:3-oxoacyl-[acyl-carrier protein] reductase
MELKGKRALVTGGSRGIGKEIVLDFLRHGAQVTFVSQNPSPFLAEMEDAARAGGVAVAWKQVDVSREEEANRLVEQVLAETGGLDILVNNAGITRDGLIFRMSGEDWEKVLRVNLFSAFYLSREVARSMIRQRAGSIINVSSVVGIGGNAGQANYAASKAGLIGLTKSLAKEVASRGVRVNAVAPGYIETDMTARLPEKAREAMRAQIPLGRAGEPREVAAAVTFLASDRSSYLTGHVLRVDGGMAI